MPRVKNLFRAIQKLTTSAISPFAEITPLRCVHLKGGWLLGHLQHILSQLRNCRWLFKTQFCWNGGQYRSPMEETNGERAADNAAKDKKHENRPATMPSIGSGKKSCHSTCFDNANHDWNKGKTTLHDWKTLRQSGQHRLFETMMGGKKH